MFCFDFFVIVSFNLFIGFFDGGDWVEYDFMLENIDLNMIVYFLFIVVIFEVFDISRFNVICSRGILMFNVII